MADSPCESHADVIRQVLSWLARRHHLPRERAEEFASDAWVKLLANDCDVLRRHQGRSSMRTYLTVVLSNHFQDWRRRDPAGGGRWRPSMVARRAGDAAVALERLIVRDRLTFEQAVEALRTNEGCTIPVDELHAMALTFPMRDRHTEVSEDDAGERASSETAEAMLLATERARVGAGVRAALARAIESLEPGDRLLLRLVFESETRLADVARTLGLSYMRVYRRRRDVLERLQRALARAGIGPDVLDDLSTADAAVHLDGLLKELPPGPSTQ